MDKDKKTRDIFNMKEIRELLDSINRPIAFRRALVDLTGSVQAALMLSQAIYWQERVTRKGGWWYKTIEEWGQETGLSRRALETARKKNRKYLLHDLRDIPARLYWKVNREALIDDLTIMYAYYSESGLENKSIQLDGKRESSLAENAIQFDRDEPAYLAETSLQEGGIAPTGSDGSEKPDERFHPNINMYAENTTEIKAEINKEKVAEINYKMREVETETEKETEKENQLLKLINSCSIVLPEVDPAELKTCITQAAEIYTPGWVREAVNEAALRDKLHIKGILEILEMWKDHGHGESSAKEPPNLGRVLRSSSR
jgi:hypothetical protein